MLYCHPQVVLEQPCQMIRKPIVRYQSSPFNQSSIAAVFNDLSGPSIQDYPHPNTHVPPWERRDCCCWSFKQEEVLFIYQTIPSSLVVQAQVQVDWRTYQLSRHPERTRNIEPWELWMNLQQGQQSRPCTFLRYCVKNGRWCITW